MRVTKWVKESNTEAVYEAAIADENVYEYSYRDYISQQDKWQKNKGEKDGTLSFSGFLHLSVQSQFSVHKM